MRVILAGGGTGGHVIPALAIAHQLKKQYSAALLFIGTARGIENRLVPAAGFELRLVKVGALNRVSLATRCRTLLDLPRSIWEAGRILKDFDADVVIGVGGYASGPAMAAAIRQGTPTLAFEPNVVPGFANRVIACRYFPHCRVTGVPVRAAFFQISRKPPGPAPTLLVFGGSQGARAINEAMIESLPGLRERTPSLRIVHQTGERDFERVRAAYEKTRIGGEVHKFIDDMPGMFAHADLLVCRSGASTVAEITAAGKPAIFVPFPHAADDHQNVNARALERAGAAVVVEESKLEAAYLVDTVAALITDPSRLQGMSLAARSLAHPRAVEEIGEMVKELAEVGLQER
jgi:UDP-N-acetylglucosamine--N-acetylmuramyl-(pentapeptide) pyrophosphoryl-undecaprenol N-acetylglucosamine transferase